MKREEKDQTIMELKELCVLLKSNCNGLLALNRQSLLWERHIEGQQIDVRTDMFNVEDVEKAYINGKEYERKRIRILLGLD